MLAMIVPRYCSPAAARRREASSLFRRKTVPVTLLFLLCCASGCATHVTPPADVHDPATVYVTNYGRHASLILPTASGTLTEFSFGDWTFYAEAKTGPANAIAALFWSRRSALGRRSIADDTPSELARELKATVQPIRVEREAASVLNQQLEERYAQHLQTEIYNSAYQTYFVADDEHYGLCNNSNMITARWLRQLGCTVHGPALLSNFIVDPTRPVQPGAALQARSVAARVKKPNDS
jgi:hypothetical protein